MPILPISSEKAQISHTSISGLIGAKLPKFVSSVERWLAL